MKLFPKILAVAIVCTCGSEWQLRGQTTASVTATVQFSNGETATVSGSSNPIGLQLGDLVHVIVKFPPNAIGQPVVVDGLDGGATSIANSLPVVGNDATFSFSVVAAAKPGSNSVTIRAGLTTFHLNLWVLDPANPKNNPSALTAVSH
jgi:hypothetical protein